ncbi:MAG: hypothetical protein M3Y17_10450, partial [Actinomycetota bacterium]|nr:hypothetical protein [Actinomycetota bacterium]
SETQQAPSRTPKLEVLAVSGRPANGSGAEAEERVTELGADAWATSSTHAALLLPGEAEDLDTSLRAVEIEQLQQPGIDASALLL